MLGQLETPDESAPFVLGVEPGHVRYRRADTEWECVDFKHHRRPQTLPPDVVDLPESSFALAAAHAGAPVWLVLAKDGGLHAVERWITRETGNPHWRIRREGARALASMEAEGSPVFEFENESKRLVAIHAGPTTFSNLVFQSDE